MSLALLTGSCRVATPKRSLRFIISSDTHRAHPSETLGARGLTIAIPSRPSRPRILWELLFRPMLDLWRRRAFNIRFADSIGD
jgi:hypothetical protein